MPYQLFELKEVVTVVHRVAKCLLASGRDGVRDLLGERGKPKPCHWHHIGSDVIKLQC